MAPHNPNATRRYWFDYEVNGIEHTMMMRTSPGVSAVDALADFTVFVGALDTWGYFYASRLVGMRTAGAGSDISVDAPVTGDLTWGDGTASEDRDMPYFLALAGRDLTGTRVTWHMFGAKSADVGGDYRHPTAGDANLTAIRNAIADTEGTWLTVAGNKPIIKAYVNTGYNAYWQRKARTN